MYQQQWPHYLQTHAAARAFHMQRSRRTSNKSDECVACIPPTYVTPAAVIILFVTIIHMQNEKNEEETKTTAYRCGAQKGFSHKAAGPPPTARPRTRRRRTIVSRSSVDTAAAKRDLTVCNNHFDVVFFSRSLFSFSLFPASFRLNYPTCVFN